MFMFSLAGDAREWYHSIPPASISSLIEFHASFTAYCQRLYSPKFIFHNCCGEYHESIQKKVVSDVDCEDYPDDLDQESFLFSPHSLASEVGYESDGYPRGEEGSLSVLMEQVKYLSAHIERLKSEYYAEDLPVPEADVPNGSFEETVEYLLDELASAPNELAVSDQTNT
jgi:hypothetical protein